MKRTKILGLAVLLAAGLAACTPASGVKSGAAAGEALIKMIPEDATGVVGLDIPRLMTTDFVVKALQEPKNKEKLDEFVKMSGIDPTKDIYYLGAGGKGGLKGMSFDGGAIVTLKYDQAKLQSLIKTKAPEAKEEVYEGVTVYSNIDGDDAGSQSRLAFLDADHLVLGSETGVKGIIDVVKKKAGSLAKNPEMMALVKQANMSSLFWGSFAVPPELLKKGLEQAPQLQVLESVKGLVLGLDDRANGVVADIKTVGGTKEQNTNLAQALNGFRAMGAMAAGNDQTLNELLNGIAITSGDDYTDITITIPNELMGKLGEKAKAKAGELMKPKKEETPEEKK